MHRLSAILCWMLARIAIQPPVLIALIQCRTLDTESEEDVQFRYAGKNLMQFAVFWHISLQFCGFRTPLMPPPFMGLLQVFNMYNLIKLSQYVFIVLLLGWIPTEHYSSGLYLANSNGLFCYGACKQVIIAPKKYWERYELQAFCCTSWVLLSLECFVPEPSIIKPICLL